MGNGHSIMNELITRCDKTHAHQPLMGGRASRAQEYSYKFCRAMCRGLAKQKQYDRSGKLCVGMMAKIALMFFSLRDEESCAAADAAMMEKEANDRQKYDGAEAKREAREAKIRSRKSAESDKQKQKLMEEARKEGEVCLHAAVCLV